MDRFRALPAIRLRDRWPRRQIRSQPEPGERPRFYRVFPGRSGMISRSGRFRASAYLRALSSIVPCQSFETNARASWTFMSFSEEDSAMKSSSSLPRCGHRLSRRLVLQMCLPCPVEICPCMGHDDFTLSGG